MKQWLKGIFYAPKHTKPTDENILRLLMPSVVGIFICMVCLAGSTWAWFSATVQTVPQTIEAANYDISVAVDGELVSSPGTLEAGQQYTVTLTAIGNAPSGGHCIVTNDTGAAPLYTATLLPGKTLTFTLIPDDAAVYTFTAVWGEYSDKPDITDGCIIGQEQPDAGAEAFGTPADDTDTAEYVVQSGDTLWEMALAYDMTVAELAAYNDIDEPASLQVGQTIKIPTEENEPLPSSATPSAPPDGTAEPDTSAGSTEGAFDAAGSGTGE